MSSDCSLLTGNGARTLIQGQVATVMAYGDETYQITLDAINSLSEGTAQIISQAEGPPPVDDSEKPSSEGIPEFTRPTAVDPLDLEFNLPEGPPEPPNVGEVPAINAVRVGAFSAVEPTYDLPPRPGELNVDWPDDPSALVVPTYPTAPVITDPALPVLTDITLPTLDPIDLAGIEAWLAELRAAAPDAPDVFIDGNFLAMIAMSYGINKDVLNAFLAVSPIPAAVSAALTTQLAGDSIGIPAPVAQALRERVYASEDEQAWRAKREVLVDWQARGFTLPGGALDAKLWMVDQQARDKKAAANLGLWTEEAKLEIQAFQFAIQQGIAYEAMYRDSWFKLYDLSRQIAAQYYEIQIKVLEAKIELYKAKWAGLTAEYEAVKIALQAELAKLEIFKGELEAAKLQGDLNEQQVTLYRSLLEGVKLKVEIYQAEISAANALLAAEVQRFQVFGEQIKAGVAKVGAYEAEWRGYAAAAQGELGRVEIYKTLAQAYGIRVDAFAKEVDADKAAGDFQLETHKLNLQAWQSRAELFKTLLQGEVARVESTAKIYDTQVRGYATTVQAESAYVETEIKRVGVDVDIYRVDQATALGELQVLTQKLIETSKITVGALEAIARTGAQLSAGALSALNMSAGIHDGFSESNSSSCGVSYNYSQ